MLDRPGENEAYYCYFLNHGFIRVEKIKLRNRKMTTDILALSCSVKDCGFIFKDIFTVINNLQSSFYGLFLN